MAFFDWNDKTKAQLRALWDEGHSTIEIGRRLGVSKNAVVGTARRIGCTPRPSPITRNGVAGQRLPRPPASPRTGTLPVLPSAIQRFVEAAPDPAPVADDPPPVVTAPAPDSLTSDEFITIDGSDELITVETNSPVDGSPRPEPERCRFPLWGNCRPTHVYCDEPKDPGRSYCAAHHARAFMKVSPRLRENRDSQTAALAVA